MDYNTLPETHETFFARLEPWMAPKNLLTVKIGYQLAKSGHRYQTRKQCDVNGTPVRYFNHPRSVAIFLIDTLGVREVRPILCGLLHDTLEDTRITAEMIEHLFGEQVASDVKLLSKLPKEGYYERLEKYGNMNVWMVKVSDRIDNLRSMEGLDESFKSRQKDETYKKIYPIIRLMEQNFSNEKEREQTKTLYHVLCAEMGKL